MEQQILERTYDEGMWWEEVLPNTIDPDNRDLHPPRCTVVVDAGTLSAARRVIYRILVQDEAARFRIDQRFLRLLIEELYAVADVHLLCCEDIDAEWSPAPRMAAIEWLCAPDTWVLNRPLSAKWLSTFLPRTFAHLRSPTDALLAHSWNDKGIFYHLQLTMTGLVLRMVLQHANRFYDDDGRPHRDPDDSRPPVDLSDGNSPLELPPDWDNPHTGPHFKPERPPEDCDT